LTIAGYCAAAGIPAYVIRFSDDGTIMRMFGLVYEKITGWWLRRREILRR
jgi:hypothetical protein